MSRDPVDVVREWFDAFNRGDLVVLAKLYADDAELDGNEGIARGGTPSSRSSAEGFT